MEGFFSFPSNTQLTHYGERKSKRGLKIRNHHVVCDGKQKPWEHLIKERLVNIFKVMLVASDLGRLIWKYRWSCPQKDSIPAPDNWWDSKWTVGETFLQQISFPFAQPVACLSCLSFLCIIHIHPSVSKVSSSRDTFTHLPVSPIFYRFSLLLGFLHWILSHCIKKP